MIRRGLALAAAAAVSAACGTTQVPRFGEARIVSQATANGATPMFAVSPDGRRALSWVTQPSLEEPAVLHLSVTADDDTITGVLRDPLGGITPHGEAPPQVLAGGGNTLFALYTVGREIPGRRFPASALRFARSDDGGATWSDPVSVNEGEAFGSHNFHSLLAHGSEVYAAWLSSVEGTSGVWLRRSGDGGRTWEPSRPVHREPTCPCCRTALALGSDGTLYAAWRKIFERDVRDIVVARSKDHGVTWEAPVRPRADDWVYPGCPHAGPSLKVDDRGAVHVAWWTGKPGEAGVYYATSTDGGQNFTATPIATADHSTPAHVQLAIAPDVVTVVWDDGHSDLPGVLLRTNRNGRGFGEALRLSAPDQAASFPVIGAWGDSLLVAWTQVGSEAHHAEQKARAAAGPNGPMPLPRVGQSEIVARVGSLR